MYGSKNSKNSNPPESPLAFLFEDFRQKLDHLLPRPDSSKLHHPPPSLANCGTAETREIFRAVGGVCGIRWHQRRARRAERASFSAFVSNPDFRVPRLRQIRWWAADKAVRRRKRGHPRDQNRGRGYRGVAALARSGPGAARASLMSIFPQAWIQAFARERGISFLDGVSLPRRERDKRRNHAGMVPADRRLIKYCSTILARNAWCGDARLRRVSRSSALVSSEVSFNSANCRPLCFMHLADHNWTWYVYRFLFQGTRGNQPPSSPARHPRGQTDTSR